MGSGVLRRYLHVNVKARQCLFPDGYCRTVLSNWMLHQKHCKKKAKSGEKKSPLPGRAQRNYTPEGLHVLVKMTLCIHKEALCASSSATIFVLSNFTREKHF